MTRILDSVESPADLKGFSLSQLRQLAQEIREELVATVTLTGGHLASNLGVVELTLALHRVFDSPRDKLIWDVGHQSYVHKMLTGRRSRFPTLRQGGGLSGFTDPEESPHDPFVGGHASTSISAALGMALARDLAGEDFHTVAIIGDGALTGGIAYEAMNQAGHLRARLLVVLNDNGMAISPSVGGLARWLNSVRFNRGYLGAKEGARRLLRPLPGGRRLWHWAGVMKNELKGLLLPQALWQGLGLNYVGPVDGHNLSELERVLRRVKETYRRPTLVHVVTVKGKGYAPAERDAESYHGIPPARGAKNGSPSYSQVFAQTVLRLFRENPKVVAITAAMPTGTGLNLVAREFPGRVFDVGICEQHAVTFAAGLATQGFIPIVAIYSTFLQRAFDQVVTDVCLQNLPVVLVLDRSGLVGEDGKTHHGNLDLSYLSLIPNLVVAAPRDENQLQHLLFTAVAGGKPMALRYPRGHGVGVPLEQSWRAIPLGQGEVLRAGEHLTLLAIGATVPAALEAAEGLAQLGIAASVVDARFAKPLDSALILEQAQRTGRLITVEENALWGGFGAAVSQLLHREGVAVRMRSIALPDEFVGQGSQDLLRSRYHLNGAGIARQVVSYFPELIATAATRASLI